MTAKEMKEDALKGFSVYGIKTVNLLNEYLIKYSEQICKEQRVLDAIEYECSSLNTDCGFYEHISNGIENNRMPEI